MTTRTDVIVDFQPSPRVVEIASPSTEITIQDLIDTLRVDEEAFTRGLSFPKLIDAAGKEDLGGGVRVGITANLRDAQVSFQARTTPAQTGTVTTGSSAPAIGYITFEDTGADFIAAGVVRGSLVINFTDRSIADVGDVISPTSLRTKVLVNGSTNTFSVTDDYQVFNIIQCNISGGNLVAVDEAISSISPAVPTAFTQIVRTASSSATLQESRDIQYSSFNGCVTVNESGVYAGTSFPSGTPRQPVNNWTDALNIANERGISKFCVLGNATLTGFVFDNYVFEGQSISKSTITINASASVLASEFNNCTVTGTLDGNSIIEKAAVTNLNFVDGIIRNTGLLGTITLSGASNLQILNCYEGSSIVPIIDFNGSGSGLIVTNYNGSIQLDNKTGSENAYLDIASGEIIISNSVMAGNITLRGVAKWENKFSYAGSANIIDETIFTRVDETHGQIIRSIFLDGSAASNGNGYQNSPFDNWADAITASTDRGLRTLHIAGDTTMDRDIANYEIIGTNLPTFSLGGFKIDNVSFEGCVITGIQGTTAALSNLTFLKTCGILSASNLNLSTDGCAIGGTIGIADDVNCVFNEPTEINPSFPIIIDMTNGALGSSAAFEGATGKFTIINCDHADDRVIINFQSGEVVIDNSCTAGMIELNGIGNWSNATSYTGTSTVVDNLVSPTSTQYSQYTDSSVWISSSGVSGTSFPRGTQQFPVDNDVDAQTVAAARALKNINILDNQTVLGTHTDMKFWGRSPRTTTLTIDNSATIIGCEFENMLLSGVLTGNTYITKVALKNVTGLIGHMEQCVIREGTNVLGGAGIGMFNKCVAASAAGPGVDIPILDCAGSGQSVAFRALVGEIKIINKNGPEPMSLALNGARVELDSTVTNGSIRVFGVGTIIDNSGGTAVVDRSELVAPEYNMEAVWSAAAASFNASGSMGEAMNDLWSMATGKIVESPSGTFTFYDRDNITVRFVLTKAGSQRNRS